MSITLLTSVPGGGKTSYSVWYEIKKAHEAGRVLYTCGIPQLKIPTIELSYDQVREWYLRDDSGDLPVLENIERGALIVIDEVQKLWPATGSKITQDIKDLSEHRHFGLSFFLMTQSPNLIHRNVLALVDRHLHIRPNWSGRKIYEWPEFCRNPSAASNKNVAVVSSYTLPDKAFSLYHSASVHIKPKKKIPLPFFGFLAVLLAIPFLIYASYDRIASKGDNVEVLESVEIFDNVEVDEVVMLDSPPVEDVVLSPVLPTLLSGRYDWQNVAGCMRSEEIGCVCYGESAERLVIPFEACQIAVRHGWTRRSIRVSAPVQVSASN